MKHSYGYSFRNTQADDSCFPYSVINTFYNFCNFGNSHIDLVVDTLCLSGSKQKHKYQYKISGEYNKATLFSFTVYLAYNDKNFHVYIRKNTIYGFCESYAKQLMIEIKKHFTNVSLLNKIAVISYGL